MNEDDFLLDEDEDLDSLNYVEAQDDSDDDDEDDGDIESKSEEDSKSTSERELLDANKEGRLTPTEIKLSANYNNIALSSKKNDEKVSLGGAGIIDACVSDAVRNVLDADPKNTSSKTVEDYMKNLFNLQGKNRIPAGLYTPDRPIRNSDLEDEFGGLDDGGFNEEYTKSVREHIEKFVEYLASRDLSKDSIMSRKRKQRQLPAFIIFLFSSNMYDLIMNCPTMPPEYQVQIDNAFKKIQKNKTDIIEELASIYDKKGRHKVAERVRDMGVAWFNREPAMLTSISDFADLDLTPDDVVEYRKIRPKYNNSSKTITQELISDYIEVVVDKDAGIYEKLKDRTRSEAISDVKRVYKEWSNETAEDSEISQKIIWKDLNLVKN